MSLFEYNGEFHSIEDLRPIPREDRLFWVEHKTQLPQKPLFLENIVTDSCCDRMTSRARGFGFVTMSTPEEAQKAIDALNGKQINGPRSHELATL